MNKDLLIRARNLLENQTPMAFDCGRVCGAVCCGSDEDGKGGVFLFPGEEKLIGEGWMSVEPSETTLSERSAPTLIMTCEGVCDRSLRPLGCMIFPLTPVVNDEGRVDVRFDYRARPICPILRDGLRGLRSEFVDAVREALNLIAQDSEGLDFLRGWQALEEQYNFKL